MSLPNAKDMLRITVQNVKPEPCDLCCKAIRSRSERGIFSAYVPHHNGGRNDNWDGCYSSLSMLGYVITGDSHSLCVNWGGMIEL